MIARNRIRCIVVKVDSGADRWTSRGALARDILPWADPYVAQLIQNLQEEVRRERRQSPVGRLRSTRSRLPGAGLERSERSRWAAVSCEADPSWFDPQVEFEPARDDNLPESGSDSQDVPFAR